MIQYYTRYIEQNSGSADIQSCTYLDSMKALHASAKKRRAPWKEVELGFGYEALELALPFMGYRSMPTSYTDCAVSRSCTLLHQASETGEGIWSVDEKCHSTDLERLHCYFVTRVRDRDVLPCLAKLTKQYTRLYASSDFSFRIGYRFGIAMTVLSGYVNDAVCS